GDAYRPEDQARRLAAFVDALRLKDWTLVVHDFGGPIGLSLAIERPDAVRRLVLFNTWMWSLAGDRQYRRVDRLFSGRLRRSLFYRAEVMELPDAGHAPQETRGAEVAPVVARFLDTGRTP